MWVDQGWHPRSGAFDTLCFAQPQKIQPSTVTGLCPVFNPKIEYKPSDAPMVGWEVVVFLLLLHGIDPHTGGRFAPAEPFRAGANPASVSALDRTCSAACPSSSLIPGPGSLL